MTTVPLSLTMCPCNKVFLRCPYLQTITTCFQREMYVCNDTVGNVIRNVSHSTCVGHADHTTICCFPLCIVSAPCHPSMDLFSHSFICGYATSFEANSATAQQLSFSVSELHILKTPFINKIGLEQTPWFGTVKLYCCFTL